MKYTKKAVGYNCMRTVRHINPVVYFLTTKVLFRLFPIISISQKFLIIFFLTLEKIGIDEKVICYHNISN